MASLLFPAVIWFSYRPGAFIYFNLMGVSIGLMLGVSIGLMLGVFKLECKMIGFNPLEQKMIALSPEVRKIVLRITAWFKRHQSATPLGILSLFMLLVILIEAVGPSLNQITNPWLGLVLTFAAMMALMAPVAVLQTIHWSALHPPESSVTELIGLMKDASTPAELTPDLVEHASKTKVNAPTNLHRRIAIGTTIGALAMLELVGSGVLSQSQEFSVLMPTSLVLVGIVLSEMVFSYVSKWRTILEEILDPET